MRDIVMFLIGGFTFLGLAALAIGIAGELFFPNRAFFGTADGSDADPEPGAAAERDRHIRILSAEDIARHAQI